LKYWYSTSFTHLPIVEEMEERFTLSIPPIILNRGKIDLDLGALVMADHVSLDRKSFDHLTRYTHYAQLVSTIRALEDLPRLTIIDFPKLSSTEISRVIQSADHELANPLTWQPALIHMMNKWSDAQVLFKEAFSDEYNELFMGSDYGVLSALKKSGTKITPENVERLTELARS
jgi:hypothetical protein